MKRILIALMLCVFAASYAGATATIVIVNNDGPGEGFNDNTPAAPVGGNPGVTLGQQRLNAFQFAADIWSCILDSDITIRIQAQFNPLSCGPSSGVLGGAGPLGVWRDFTNRPIANTWYAVAQANALAGADLDPVGNDISATFNSDVGTPGCLETSGWYLGLDNNAPSNEIDLVVVLLHEFAHGLGSASFVDESTGALLGGFHDAWNHFLFDNTTGKLWSAMSDPERQASAINTNNLAWTGPTVTAALPGFLCSEVTLEVTAPGAIAGFYTAPAASFYPCNSTATGDVVLVDDNVGTTSDGCSGIVNDVNGKIALIDRGACAFVDKVLNAQAAGAIGVIVANNVAGAPFAMGGSSAGINIPAVMISQADGNTIKAQLGVGVTATIGLGATMSGADASGRLTMYTPNPVEPGSSVSHWNTTATPNLLMEPSINSDLAHDVDLTEEQFIDLGWPMNAAPTVICQNVSVDADSGLCTAVVTPAQVDNGSFDPNGDGINLSLEPAGPYAEGVTVVDLIVDDGWLADTCQASITVTKPVTAVPEGHVGFYLGAASPNPFAGRTQLQLTLTVPGTVQARVFDAQGRMIRVIQNGFVPVGESVLEWDGRADDGREVGAGVYFIQVISPEATETQKVVMRR